MQIFENIDSAVAFLSSFLCIYIYVVILGEAWKIQMNERTLKRRINIG